jgi:hypothetical protein
MTAEVMEVLSHANGLESVAAGKLKRTRLLSLHPGSRAIDVSCELATTHLAAALVLSQDDLLLATRDQCLHTAASAEGLALIPETLDPRLLNARSNNGSPTNSKVRRLRRNRAPVADATPPARSPDRGVMKKSANTRSRDA